MPQSTACHPRSRHAFSWTQVASSWHVSREMDGGRRFKTVGVIGGKLYAVVATWRGDVCRIISARRTNAAEGKAYGRG